MTVNNQTGVVLLTLAAETALVMEGPTMTRGGRLLSVRGLVNIRSLTTGDGPFIFGIAEKSLQLSEIQAFFGPRWSRFARRSPGERNRFARELNEDHWRISPNLSWSSTGLVPRQPLVVGPKVHRRSRRLEILDL